MPSDIDTSVGEALDELALAVSGVESAWSDVVARARPRRQGRRQRATTRRLIVVVGIAVLLIGAAVAGARQFDMFDGTPAPDSVKAQIATLSLGAPPALDPGIEADKTVAMIHLPVAKGVVTLYASPAKKAAYTYCVSIRFSWNVEGAGPGCMGPVNGSLPPIDIGIMFPGSAARPSMGYAFGRINDERAESVRFALTDGSTKTVPLTEGFYVTTLDPGQKPTRAEALDVNGTVIATKELPTKVIGIPSP
jgi:hypothetical protein